MAQGPFKDQSLNEGYICFQNTPDKRNIDFFQSFKLEGAEINSVVDTFYYSDAPVELVTVFFAKVHGRRNVVVLLRWNVGYEKGRTKYTYYYEVKTYEQQDEGKYILKIDSDKDPNFSGYQTLKDGVVTNFKLYNAGEIKKYLENTYK